MMMLAAIEWDKIAQLLWVGPLAALAVTVAFGVLLTGSVRMSDARRAGTSVVAAAYGVLAALGGVAFLAVVVYGLHIIIKK
jgi:hypothetical protein